MKRSLCFIASLAALVSVSSCINEDYDLEKIKVDEFAVLEGVVLPIGSTDVISISDFLTLDQEDGFVKTDDAGNFYVSISDSELLNQKFTIDEFSLYGYDAQPKEVGAGFPVTVPSFNTDREYQAEVAFGDVSYDVEINQNNFPEIVTGIRSVDVSSVVTVDLHYDKSELPFNQIHICAGATIEFPEWIVLGEVSSVFEKENSHKLKFAQNMAITPDGTAISIPIDGLDFTNLPENQGVIGKGHLYLDAPITLKNGKLLLRSVDCISSGTFTPKVISDLHLDPMTVESICLSGLDLGEAANISQDIDFTDMLPEMLYDENIVCDFNDLRLKIWMKNGLPFSGAVNTFVDTYKNGSDSPLRHFAIGFPFVIDADGHGFEHLYTENGENGSIKVEGFNSILNPVPDFLRINTSVSIDSENDAANYGVLTPGHTYEVQCGYEFIAPLSFGDEFRLGMTQDITGLGLEVSEVEVAEVQLKMNLVNALPLDLAITGEAIDADGNVLDHIGVELIGDIKGGTIESPAVNPIIFKLTNNGELKVDGIRVSMTASAADAKAALNKNQYIQLTDISVSLPKGIKYTINE